MTDEPTYSIDSSIFQPVETEMVEFEFPTGEKRMVGTELAAKFRRLHAAAPEMLALLDAMSSRSLDGCGYECGHCAWCGNTVGVDGHDSDCRLAAVLRKARGDS